MSQVRQRKRCASSFLALFSFALTPIINNSLEIECSRSLCSLLILVSFKYFARELLMHVKRGRKRERHREKRERKIDQYFFEGCYDYQSTSPVFSCAVQCTQTESVEVVMVMMMVVRAIVIVNERKVILLFFSSRVLRLCFPRNGSSSCQVVLLRTGKKNCASRRRQRAACHLN